MDWYPKTKNSLDLSHYFLGVTQIQFQKRRLKMSDLEVPDSPWSRGRS